MNNNIAGAMQRSTLYRVEAFAPWAMADLLHLLGRRATPGRKKFFHHAAVQRHGGLFVPVGRVLSAMPRLPDDIVRSLLGVPLWVENFHNLVTTAGLNDSLDKQFKASSYTAAWYVGLTAGSPTFAAGDTMSSHSGWTEVTAYSESNRPTLTLGSVSGGSVDNSASKATYSISSNSTTIGGGFIVTNNTKGGTTGTLYGGGAFTAGNKTLDNGDTLSVTATLTATSA